MRSVHGRSSQTLRRGASSSMSSPRRLGRKADLCLPDDAGDTLVVCGLSRVPRSESFVLA